MRLKVPPPAVFVVAALLLFAGTWFFPQLTYPFPGQGFVAIALVFFGCLAGGSAVGVFFKYKTTVDPTAPETATSLVTTGIFRFSRNPMYLGLLCLLLALAVYWGTLTGLAVVPLFIWYLTEFQIKPEEERLKNVFGEPYADYLSRVRRWL